MGLFHDIICVENAWKMPWNMPIYPRRSDGIEPNQTPNQTPNRIEARIRLKENHNSFLQDWTAWTECVQPCGGEGSRQRSRNSTEAMHGGEDKGNGETSIGLILAETLGPWKTKIEILIPIH